MRSQIWNFPEINSAPQGSTVKGECLQALHSKSSLASVSYILDLFAFLYNLNVRPCFNCCSNSNLYDFKLFKESVFIKRPPLTPFVSLNLFNFY